MLKCLNFSKTLGYKFKRWVACERSRTWTVHFMFMLFLFEGIISFLHEYISWCAVCLCSFIRKNKPTSNPVWSCPRWGTYCISVITNNKWETQSGSEGDSQDGWAVNRIILGSKCDRHLAEVWRVQSAPHQCSAFFPLGLRYTLAGHGANGQVLHLFTFSIKKK